MHTIFQTLVYQREKGHDAVLATIIWDDGSAPRGKGSQMLVGRDGLLAGTIGGGAVEGQAIALAQEMLHSGADNHTHEFRLRRDGSAQSTGMVCGGDVTVYFRRIPAADGVWDTLAAEVLRRLGAREPGWLVQPLDGAMPYLSDNDTGKENCFTMPLPIGERALIFGAGHIARALVPLLCTVGFRPVVFDDRPQFCHPGAIPAGRSGHLRRLHPHRRLSDRGGGGLCGRHDQRPRVRFSGTGTGAARRDSLCGRHRLPEENSLRQPAPAGGGDLRGGHRLCAYAGGYGHQGGDAGGTGGIHCRGNDPCAGHPP